ncbi:hypothetical protein ABZR34_31200 [Pseudomonas paraeruginosa]|uniref:hypothetical protein n=1 Tax=Pseudomonas paraeruginosa TaxID=2994495 RepID=UPI00345AA193
MQAKTGHGMDGARLIDRMMEILLSEMEKEGSDLHAALVDNSENIRALAEICQQTGVFKRGQAAFAEFKKHLEESTPSEHRLVESWSWLLGRIVNAPTTLHMHGAVRLCVPLVALYLPLNEPNPAEQLDH